MGSEFGVNFLPGGDDQKQAPGQGGQAPSGVSPQQSAIKFLSLRLPRFSGPGGIAPPSLLNGPGGGGMDPGMMKELLQRLAGMGPKPENYEGNPLMPPPGPSMGNPLAPPSAPPLSGAPGGGQPSGPTFTPPGGMSTPTTLQPTGGAPGPHITPGDGPAPRVTLPNPTGGPLNTPALPNPAPRELLPDSGGMDAASLMARLRGGFRSTF